MSSTAAFTVLPRPGVFDQQAHYVPEEARRTESWRGWVAFSQCTKLCWADDEAAPNLQLCPKCFQTKPTNGTNE